MDEATPTRMQATCRTAGCPAEGVACVQDMFPNAAAPTWRASCGQCGQDVTDVVPAP